MTPEQRCEIAEWCGWEFITRHPGWAKWVTPAGAEVVLPPAYDDLDSCAEFERIADERGLAMRYAAAVYDTYPNKDMACHRDWHICLGLSATPAQRCEAILKVIKETKA